VAINAFVAIHVMYYEVQFNVQVPNYISRMP